MRPPSASPRLTARSSAARAGGIADAATVRRGLHEASAYLRTSRPTAVNLFWALDRIDQAADSAAALDGPALLERLLAEARAIAR